MTELSQIVAATAAAHQNALPALLATVVRVRGSSYRRPGARMLLTTGGWEAGCISGGCLESDIIRKAWWRTESGEPVVVTYDSTLDLDLDDDDHGSYDDPLSWGLGLGCNGVVEVLLERLSPGDPACPVAFIGACLGQRSRGIIATVIASEKAGETGQRLLWHGGDRSPVACTITDPSLAMQIGEAVRESLTTVQTVSMVQAGQPTQTLRIDRAEVLLETISPPTPLLICGANHDAAPLARLANATGWEVTVIDPWAGSPPRPERFPGAETVLSCAPAELAAQVPLEDGAFAVVMSHNLAHDAAFLAALLPSPVRYIGVLGPRARTERLLCALGERGIFASGERDRDRDSRLHGPMGLDIGAEEPENIALSILAEMQAVKTGRDGGFLRDRARSIHDGNDGSDNGAAPREPENVR